MLESDKATMDVPSPAAGNVTRADASRSATRSPRARAILDARGAPATATAPSRRDAPDAEAAPSRRGAAQPPPRRADADVHDAGRRARRRPGRLHGRVPRRRPRAQTRAGRALRALGGVCLNVGCIPSKALLHVAKVIAEAEELGRARASPSASRRSTSTRCARWKDGVVGKLTGGLDGAGQAAQGRGRARRRRASPARNTLEVDGGRRRSRFEHASSPPARSAATLPGPADDDPRIMDSTGALELDGRPRAAARHRRRDHRPRDGDGLRRARLEGHRRRAARPADPRRRQGPRQAAAEARSRSATRRSTSGRSVEAVEARDDGPDGHASTATREPQIFDRVLVAVGRAPERRAASAPTRAGVDGRRARLHRASTRSCARTCRTSSRSATSSASRCSPTRRRTRARSPPR